MDAPRSVAIVVGSLRRDSFSRKIALDFIERAKPRLACTIAEIGDLPLYNEDLDNSPPPSWERFRGEVSRADAVLFITPEYNRSVPGVLKNALDVGSRPADQSVFKGKPAGVISQTPYKLGAFGANHALRQTFVFLDMPVLQQPEMYIGGAGELFDEKARIKVPQTVKLFGTFIEAFDRWIGSLAAKGAPDFGTFMKERSRVAAAYVNGDAAALEAIVTQHDPATFFPPGGAPEQGAAAVARSYQAGATHFSPGSTSELQVLQSGAGNLAFWTGLQRARVKLQGKAEAVPMLLRITEVFRVEQGSWKLVHRHADMPESRNPAHGK